MTTSANPRPAAASPRRQGATRRPQWMRAARRPLEVYVVIGAWMWAVCLVGVSAAIFITDRVGTVELSVVQFVRNGPLVWLLFTVGIIIVAACLTPHVANGMTRGSFVVGTVVAATIGSLLHGLTSAGFVLLERLVYDRMGWVHGPVEGDHYTAGVWEAGAVTLVLDHSLTTFAGSVAGLLVGITYYRLGAWWATLALPLSLLPVVVVMFSTTWSRAPIVPVDTPAASVYLVGWGLVLAAGVAFVLLVRRVPIARTES